MLSLCVPPAPVFLRRSARCIAGVGATDCLSRWRRKMAGLYFEEALLKSGWAAGVRIEMAGGLIAAVETGTRPGAGDERHAIGLPRQPQLPHPAFPRGPGGRARAP